MATKDDGRKESNNDENDSVSVKKVAIIGASFAGLTLANYLHHHQDTTGQSKTSVQYDCLVLESKDEPISIVGTFRLPLHISTDVLQPIQQMRSMKKDDLPHMTQEFDDTPKWLVSRPTLLAWLRTGVPIQYSASVKAVRRIPSSSNNDGGYLLTIQSSSGDRSELGPFDMVVVASGFSLKRNNDDWKWDCTAMVGDARCSRHAWWDVFGLTRIQKGGAMAMMDAIKLAQRIVSEQVDLKEHSPKWHQSQQRKRQQMKRLVQLILLTALLTALLGSGSFGTQQPDNSEL